ncbi:MAG: orotate phosphoribosyltransferase [Peptococcaceae bacterium]|nr:orotate phosphoribosyltransferase [Peptococcaceae bacterium]
MTTHQTTTLQPTTPLTSDAVRRIFEETGALLRGHFLLTSGKHSEYYVQCAQVLQYPDKARLLAQHLATAYTDSQISVVVGPAMGGIHLSHEVAHALGTRSLFTERVDGKMELRRNFKIAPGEKILVVEDVITTGGSVREVIRLLQDLGGEIVGIGCLVNRSPDMRSPDMRGHTAADTDPTATDIMPTALFEYQASNLELRSLPLAALLRLDIQAYEPADCPLCAQGLPWEKPGSRKSK